MSVLVRVAGDLQATSERSKKKRRISQKEMARAATI